MTTQQILQGVHDWTNKKTVYDISVAHPDGQGNPTPYADLAAALGNGGANIPEGLRKGGMSIKFIQGTSQSSDNNYVQARLMAQSFTTDVTQWQCSTMPYVFNVNLYNNVPNTAYADKSTARLAVPSFYRKFGLIITYLLADGWVIERNDYSGNGDITSNVIWSRDTTRTNKSWVTLSEKEGFDNTAANLGYYRFQRTLSSGESAVFLSPFNNSFVGKKVKVRVNTENYENLGVYLQYTDDNSDYIALTSNEAEYMSVKEIKYATVYVKPNIASDTYDVEIFGAFSLSVNKTEEGILQELEDVSEKADNIESKTLRDNIIITNIPLTIHTENEKNGYWNSGSGLWAEDNSRRGTEIINVTEGEIYLVTTKIGGSTIIGYLSQWNGNTWVGVATGFTGGSGDAVDREYVVPAGVTKIAICSYNSTEPILKKKVIEKVFAAYTKEESDSKYAGRYGVKWSISDTDDLGQRCFDAIGKIANIGIGNTNGYSDFDNIYPWSEMKRCNIKVNSNGAKIVTFEGESGFALDGSNGDVFVRIPKFCVEKYKEDGYEYRVVSRNQGFVHPAFIENGQELDEIFVAAFEGLIFNNELHSVSGVIPTSNEVAETFLDAANARGNGYNLYDLRCVDAIWTLYAVEFGSRNTNQYLGYGYANFRQPESERNECMIIESATSTNTVKVALLGASAKGYMPVGSNITICDTTQFNILTQAKITGVTDGNDYTSFTFDGDPVDVTTSCFIGSAACTTNFCETCGTSKKLNWHTGRADFISESENRNPIRYRWIENLIGSLWAFTPDVTLNDLQLYICKNINDYQFGNITTPYNPIGPLMTEQRSNGQKNDNPDVNYWMNALLDDIFAKGLTLGKNYDMSLTSRKAFGAYYYADGRGIRINVNGGGFDHDVRCNMLTNRMWISTEDKWYLYGSRLIFKNI